MPARGQARAADCLEEARGSGRTPVRWELPQGARARCELRLSTRESATGAAGSAALRCRATRERADALGDAAQPAHQPQRRGAKGRQDRCGSNISVSSARRPATRQARPGRVARVRARPRHAQGKAAHARARERREREAERQRHKVARDATALRLDVAAIAGCRGRGECANAVRARGAHAHLQAAPRCPTRASVLMSTSRGCGPHAGVSLAPGTAARCTAARTARAPAAAVGRPLSRLWNVRACRSAQFR